MSSFKSSFFISFEGIDGCGKSTQVKLLNKKMKSMSIDSIVVREPGGNTISEDIRGILLNNDFFNMSSRTEALLMAASRSQLTRDIIIPSLSKGSLIIADRYSDSTLAYQGGGRGIDVEWLISLNKFATYNTKPDLTIYLDVEVEEGLRRRKIKNLDRLESLGFEFQEKVRNQYIKLVKLFPERIVSINGMQSNEKICEEIWEIIKNRIDLNAR
tara:strand:- start:22286 stop:22927 length:642 start_codon:yes stop_codon:yes gene_type:complete